MYIAYIYVYMDIWIYGYMNIWIYGYMDISCMYNMCLNYIDISISPTS